jgi:hypothetical protein
LWALDGSHIVPTGLAHLLDVLHEVLIEVRSGTRRGARIAIRSRCATSRGSC